MTRRRQTAPPVSTVRVTAPLRAELLEDRLAPAVLNATIDPAFDNVGAIGQLNNLIAISNANGDTDTINLFPGGTYTFTSAGLNKIVANNAGAKDGITINGQGAAFVRDPASKVVFSLITVDASVLGKAPPQTLAFRDLTITNGSSGISATPEDATVDIDNVTFSNNARALSVSADRATINITNSRFLDNTATTGGAVSVTLRPLGVGPITTNVTDTTFSGNKATGGDGGAIGFVGNLIVNSSLFVNNTASGTGGAVQVTGTATFTNTTFHGNSATGAGGALFVGSGNLGVRHSTLTNNSSAVGAGTTGGGGAIHIPSGGNAVVLNHTAFHGNTNKGKGVAGGDESDVWGQITSQGNNFLSIGKAAGGLIWTPAASDQFGTAAVPLDALLGPLQNNGGPTDTRVPLSGSLLIGKGAITPAAGVTTDQRGYPRQVGKLVDIGATESQFDTPSSINRASIAISAGDRQVTAINSNFEAPFQVVVRNPFGAPLADREVSFSGSGATFPGGRTVKSAVDGTATVQGFATSLVGIHKVRAILTADQLGIDFREVNKAPDEQGRAEGVMVIIGGNNQTAAINTMYAQPLSAQAFQLDAAGNKTALANAPVLFAVIPAVAGGTFPGQVRLFQATTDAGGKAAVQITADAKAGKFQVVAAVGRFGAAVFDLTNIPGPAANLVFVSGSPQATPIATNFPDPLTVFTSDASGNPVGGVTVSFAGQNDPTIAGVTFPNGTTAVSDAGGFARLVVGANGRVGAHQVVASSISVSGSATYDLTNQQGPAATVTLVSGSGQSTVVTGAFAAPLVVEVRDAGGNLMPGIGVNFAGPETGASAAFPNGATAITGGDGRASLFLGANSKSGSYSVIAGIAGATSATFALTNRAGASALITVIGGDGQSTSIGQPFASPILVKSIDEFGNPVAGAMPIISLVEGAPAGATFTVNAAGADGVASVFATANSSVGTYRASATLPGLAVLFTLINTDPTGGTVFPPQTGVATRYAVGTGAGTAHRVWVYDDAGQRVSEFQPFDAAFAGGVRASVLRTPTDIRVLAGPGPGRFADVRIFDSAGNLIREQSPFEGTFSGGVYVAAADVNRDGWDDYAVSPDEGGGPRVQVVNGKDGSVIADFFGIADPAFRGGARVAMGDINGDGTPDVIVSAGFGGGPRVAVFDGKTLAVGESPRRLVDDFFVFEPTLRNGVFVTAGDVDGDGKAELVIGAGPGGGPRVVTLSGAALLGGTRTALNDFFAGGIDDRSGVRVALKDLDADNRADLVTGAGAGTGTRVTVYPGRFLVGQGLPGDVTSFDQIAGLRTGVFVG